MPLLCHAQQRGSITKPVGAKFGALDNLILQFGESEAGRKLIAAYQATRIVRDLGAGPTPKKPVTPMP